MITLDKNIALVVIDLQKGIVALPPADEAARVVAQASMLIDAFHARALTVALVTVVGAPPGRTEQPRAAASDPAWADLAPGITAKSGDVRIAKKSWCAFTGTELDARLKAAGITQVVFCGIATSIGVESSARAAYALGYNVAFAVDAMTDIKAEAHAHSIARIFPRMGETAQTQEIIQLLDSRA